MWQILEVNKWSAVCIDWLLPTYKTELAVVARQIGKTEPSCQCFCFKHLYSTCKCLIPQQAGIAFESVDYCTSTYRLSTEPCAFTKERDWNLWNMACLKVHCRIASTSRSKTSCRDQKGTYCNEYQCREGDSCRHLPALISVRLEASFQHRSRIRVVCICLEFCVASIFVVRPVHSSNNPTNRIMFGNKHQNNTFNCSWKENPWRTPSPWRIKFGCQLLQHILILPILIHPNPWKYLE